MIDIESIVATKKVVNIADGPLFELVLRAHEAVDSPVHIEITYVVDPCSAEHDMPIYRAMLVALPAGLTTLRLQCRPVDYTRIAWKSLVTNTVAMVDVVCRAHALHKRKIFYARVDYGDVLDSTVPDVPDDATIETDDAAEEVPPEPDTVDPAKLFLVLEADPNSYDLSNRMQKLCSNKECQQ